MTAVEVLVGESGRARVVGQAHVTRTRGQISTTFLYDPTYLADGGMNVDPALLLVARANRVGEREIVMMAESIEPRLQALAGSGGGPTRR